MTTPVFKFENTYYIGDPHNIQAEIKDSHVNIQSSSGSYPANVKLVNIDSSVVQKIFGLHLVRQNIVTTSEVRDLIEQDIITSLA